MDKKTIFETPRDFTIKNIRSFLSNVSKLFSYENVRLPEVSFVVDKTENIDILGLVLIYKFLEYSVRKKCFYKPICYLTERGYVYNELKKAGFIDIVYDFINQKPADYNKLGKVKPLKNLIVAPFFLEKDSQEDEVCIHAKDICTYYSQQKFVLDVIYMCLGEIASNFRSHSVNDTQSIMTAMCSSNYFEIACADTGVGIVSSLKHLFVNTNLSKSEILYKSVEKGVSSKDKNLTSHMGFGLWLVNQFVSVTCGELHIYSEGAYFINHQGHYKSGSCAKWKGTIIYVRIPLFKIERCKDVLKVYLKNRKN